MKDVLDRPDGVHQIKNFYLGTGLSVWSFVSGFWDLFYIYMESGLRNVEKFIKRLSNWCKVFDGLLFSNDIKDKKTGSFLNGNAFEH